MTTDNPQPTVYVVDDDADIRTSIQWLLESVGLKVGTFESAEAFFESGAFREPGCLLLDVRMPGMSGPELFERLDARGLLQRLPVIFLTGHGDVPTAVAAVKRGAYDFVEKPFSDNALVDRIEQALASSAKVLLAERAGQRLLLDFQELTEREREVMRLVMDGWTNKLIADALDISVRTVEVHRSRVFDKMGVRSAVELVNLMNAHPQLQRQWHALPGA